MATRMLMAVLCFMLVVAGTRAAVCSHLSGQCFKNREESTTGKGTCSVQERYVKCMKEALADCIATGVTVAPFTMLKVDQSEAMLKTICKDLQTGPWLITCKTHDRCDAKKKEIDKLEMEKKIKLSCRLRENEARCLSVALTNCMKTNQKSLEEVVRSKYKESAKDVGLKCNNNDIGRLSDSNSNSNGEVRTIPQTTLLMVVCSTSVVIAARLTVIRLLRI